MENRKEKEKERKKIIRNSEVVTGDLNQTTVLQVLGPAAVRTVDWNGKHLALAKMLWGTLQAVLPGLAKSIAAGLPSLKAAKRKYADSLPEIMPGYDDRRWVDVNRTNLTSLFLQYYGGPWNLSVATNYGYHVQGVLSPALICYGSVYLVIFFSFLPLY